MANQKKDGSEEEEREKKKADSKEKPKEDAPAATSKGNDKENGDESSPPLTKDKKSDMAITTPKRKRGPYKKSDKQKEKEKLRKKRSRDSPPSAVTVSDNNADDATTPKKRGKYLKSEKQKEKEKQRRLRLEKASSPATAAEEKESEAKNAETKSPQNDVERDIAEEEAKSEAGDSVTEEEAKADDTTTPRKREKCEKSDKQKEKEKRAKEEPPSIKQVRKEANETLKELKKEFATKLREQKAELKLKFQEQAKKAESASRDIWKARLHKVQANEAELTKKLNRALRANKKLLVPKTNEAWEKNYESLKQTLSLEDHSPGLKKWITAQRRKYKHLVQSLRDPAVASTATPADKDSTSPSKSTSSTDQLTMEQVGRLQAIGFDWKFEDETSLKNSTNEEANPSQTKPMQTWNRHYEALKAFQEEHGHCNVTEDVKLKGWVNRQQMGYRNALRSFRGDNDNNDDDAEVDEHEDAAEDGAVAAGTATAVETDANTAEDMTPKKKKTNNKYFLTMEQIGRLYLMGFEFDKEGRKTHVWDKHYQELVSFWAEQGRDEIITDNRLNQWISKQRLLYKQQRQIPIEEVHKKLMAGGGEDDAARLEQKKERRFMEQIGRLQAVGFKWQACPKTHDIIDITTTTTETETERNPILPEVSVVKKSQSRTRVKNWNNLFAALKAFHSEHGHFNVTKEHNIPKLKGWVDRQRRGYRNTLRMHNKDEGMNDDNDDVDAEDAEDAADEEAIDTATADGAEADADDAATPRKKKAKTERYFLTSEQIGQLQILGFNWKAPSSVHDEWEKRFQQLLDFRLKHNHLNVTLDDPLHGWISAQRTNRKLAKARGVPHSVLTEERIARLEQMGFTWNRIGEFASTFTETATEVENYDDLWEKRFEQFANFAREHGHVKILSEHDDGLYKWVGRQRTKQQKGILKEDQFQRMDELGMDWKPQPSTRTEKVWEIRFQELLAYKNEKGNCRVPYLYKDNMPLGKWVTSMRVKYKAYKASGKLPERRVFDEEKIRRLDEIGFEWKLVDRRWRKKPKDFIEDDSPTKAAAVPAASPAEGAASVAELKQPEPTSTHNNTISPSKQHQQHHHPSQELTWHEIPVNSPNVNYYQYDGSTRYPNNGFGMY